MLYTRILYTLCICYTGGSEWRVSDGGPGGHHRRLALRHTGLHRWVEYIYIGDLLNKICFTYTCVMCCALYALYLFVIILYYLYEYAYRRGRYYS